jgi:biopolymer transport protein ExbD
MRFLIRKRRSAPAVIIVALIDVLIVLVIFLLVTTTFKQQPSLKLNLPTSTSALKSGANENPPLIVNIDATGLIRYGKDNLPTTLVDLRSDLMAEAEKNPDVKLAVRADEKAPWGKIVNVMDIADEAHIKVLSAYARQANQR